MPLILDVNAHDPVALREMLHANQVDFRESLAAIEHPPGAVLDPMSLVTAADLVRAVLALSEAVDRPDAEAKTLAAMVNVQYETLLAVIDLMKSHVDMPKVPHPRR
jgi:hypothetical protein